MDQGGPSSSTRRDGASRADQRQQAWSIHPSPRQPSRATKAREAQAMQLSKSDIVPDNL